MKKKTITILISIIVLAIASIIIVQMTKKTSEDKVLINKATITVGENEVFMRAMAWGLGGHSVIALSDRPFSPDDRDIMHGIDIVFYTDVIYYKKQNNNCLKIAVTSSAVHPDNKYIVNGIKIKLVRLKYYDDNKQFEKDYENLGYLKLDIYPLGGKVSKKLFE
jgi:hypothetical protein